MRCSSVGVAKTKIFFIAETWALAEKWRRWIIFWYRIEDFNFLKKWLDLCVLYSNCQYSLFKSLITVFNFNRNSLRNQNVWWESRNATNAIWNDFVYSDLSNASKSNDGLSKTKGGSQLCKQTFTPFAFTRALTSDIQSHKYNVYISVLMSLCVLV